MSFFPDQLKARWASAFRLPVLNRPTRGTATPTISWQGLPESARGASVDGILRAFAFMPVELVLDHLQTGQNGISEAESASRRHVKGPNALSSQKPPSWFTLLLSVIPNPFNLLLIFLAIINVAMPPPNWVSKSNPCEKL